VPAAPRDTWRDEPPQDAGKTVVTRSAGDLEPDEEMMRRVTALWQGAYGEQADPKQTIKSESPGNEPEPDLIIQPRTLRRRAEPDAHRADYELLDMIGEGGVGVVYAARQASINRSVAVKMLRDEVRADSAHQEKFLSEAVVTGELDHPNIVPIYDLGRDEAGSLFYSMKWVRGTPWVDVILKKPVTENLEILLKVADAIAFAHARGVVHRDLKPENVMLGDFGEVLVMDWGIALSTSLLIAGKGISRSSSMGGTPAYMAPEMATGPLDRIGPRSDVYLLGAVLYEITTGEPPHTARTVMECLYAASRNDIHPTGKTGELINIARKAMETDPDDRYQSVQEFQAAIRRYQSHSESIVLATRAEEDLVSARRSEDYQDFARSVFAYEEALSLWDGNDKARGGLSEARLAYAESALKKGDLDLGASLLKDGVPAHARLKRKFEAARGERDSRQRRLRNLKAVAAMLMVALVGGGMIAYAQIREEAELARWAEADAVVAAWNANARRKIADQLRDRAEQSEEDAKNSAHNARVAEGTARTALK
ncbi:MAG: serine/threonine-protein kinase, partial [Vicinamibacterales bacterium]